MNRAETERPGRFCLSLTIPSSLLQRADQVIE